MSANARHMAGDFPGNDDNCALWQRHERDDDVVRRQTLWRFVNERMRELDRRRASDEVANERRPTKWARCECGRTACTVVIRISPHDYDRLARARMTSFVVAPSHEVPSADRVIVRCADFTIVEAVGQAATIASVAFEERRACTSTP